MGNPGAGTGLRFEKAFRRQLSKGLQYRAARQIQRRRQPACRRQQIARFQIAFVDSPAQGLRQLVAKLPRLAVNLAEGGDVNDLGCSGHVFRLALQYKNEYSE